MGSNTNLLEGDTETWKKILDTNVLGLCIATREAVKNMRENNVDGHIIHINSLAGHIVVNVPNLSVYTASKFAVTALTETLRQELNSIGSKTKITVGNFSAEKMGFKTPLFCNRNNPSHIDISHTRYVFLPKIHRPGKSVRPIVSGINSSTYRLSMVNKRV